MEIGTLCADALTRSFQGNNSIRVIDYRSQFKTLWLDDFEVDNHITRLFIVWDGMPADERAGRLAPYLTALDWVLAFSLKLIRKCKEDKAVHTDFTIHLINFTSDQFENSFTAENAPTLLEAMPWVTLYAPLKRGRSAYTELPTPDEVRNGNGWAEKKTLAAAAKDPGLSIRLKRIADIWQASLVRSDDHHDVNNTAGPLRLCQTMADINASPLQKAFATRLEWVYGRMLQQDILKQLKNDVDKAKGTVGGNLEIVLVDDMYSFGWDKLFEQWCGINDSVTLTRIDKPEDVVFTTEKADADKARWNKGDFLTRDFGFRFDFTIDPEPGKTGSNNQVPQVIFLDMRLHSNPANRAANERDEKEFFKELVRLIELWGLTEENNQLAWSPISKDDLINAKAWASDQRPGRPLTIHSLLPRVMALRAPHIPIIILSSTRKRSVIEPLKPYGNIFTALEKPKVIGSDDSTLEHFHSNWQEAWKHTVTLLQTNQDLKMIEEMNTAIGDKITKIRDIPQNPYVEIYIDETGDDPKNFSIGGVIAIFNNDGSKPWDRFDDVLYENGICYYDPIVPPRANKSIRIKAKKGDSCTELERVLSLSNSPKIYSFRFGYGTGLQLPQSLKNAGDILFYQPAAMALEGLLFEALPTYFENKSFEVSIYLATRILSKQKIEDTWEPIKRFGYSPVYDDKTRTTLESVSGSSVLPMILQLLAERDATRIAFDRLLAITLKYEEPGYGKDVMLANRFYCRKCGCYFTPFVTNVKNGLINKRLDSGVKRNISTNSRRIMNPLLDFDRNDFPLYPEPKSCNGNHNWTPDYRALHYLADEVLDNDNSKQEKYEKSGIHNNAIPGFLDKNDLLLQDLMRASRFAEREDSTLALITAISSVSRHHISSWRNTLKVIVLARLARCLPNLSGDEYLKVAKATHTA